MQIRRTENTTRNAIWGILDKFAQMVLPFITRTLILKLIGEKYLGLNGLFTSIITVLNMADLGFGVAITYSMYKPIADNDTEALCALLNYYKKIYRVIGFVVLGVGLALMPLLPKLIKDEIPNEINIYLLFSIYLANTVLSYWLFAYKKSLLSAYHRNDVTAKIAFALLFCQYGLQILALSVFRNYYTYVVVLPLITLTSNILTSVATKRMFPEIVCKGKADPETTGKIKKQVSGAFIGKICGQTRTSLDSMFISSFLGLTQVAIYSNYYYILSAIHNLLNVVTQSMVGGVGNSIVKESKQKNYVDFNRFSFLYSWISGWCACCMLCLYQPFMRLWVGDSLTLPFGTMVLFCVYMYTMSASDIKNVYYTAKGLWWEGRWRSLLEVVTNCVFHYFGAKYFGVAGILLATILSMVLVNFLYGSSILFKHYFSEESIARYYVRHLTYFCVVAVVSAATYTVCALLPGGGFATLLGKAVICLVLPNVLFYFAYFKTSSFADAKPFISRLLSGLIRKVRK